MQLTSEPYARCRDVGNNLSGDWKESSLLTAVITAVLRMGLSALQLRLTSQRNVLAYRTMPYGAPHFMSNLSVCFERLHSQPDVSFFTL